MAHGNNRIFMHFKQLQRIQGDTKRLQMNYRCILRLSDAPAGELAGSAASTQGKPIRSGGIQRITLEQVKQQRSRSIDPVTSPLARLSQLSIEAAKQHRLGMQADYFPKLGATFANLHFSEFLGQVLTIRRPIISCR